ncbi:MAG: precorrin-3B C(17)-methyltransferase [Lachnospiraceae bacterium]|nr:precorrin-3B C(17)-methyltransferase [Lachnospiraceae bacterium]
MGKLFVVGIGPGDERYMTKEALQALEESEVIFGFGTYAELVRKIFGQKEYRTTGMGREVERCREALMYASQEGACASVISSGDAGIYGMAGLILEMAEGYPEAEVISVTGISAAISGAAILGAPLMNDFCVISLSDHLTPLEMIEKRLRAACDGDLVVCIYNPMSKTRPGHLKRACDILLSGKKPDTVCGWVRNIGRDGMESRILPLRLLKDEKLDMFTTVFVGNSHTVMIDGKMVTKRGYEVDRE